MSRCPCCDHVLSNPVDANQLDLFTTILNAESYARGYDTGLFWDASWYPGGPSVYSESSGATKERKQMARDSKDNYKAWQHGFKDGLEIRLQNNDFRVWWEAKSKGAYARYHGPTLDNA